MSHVGTRTAPATGAPAPVRFGGPAASASSAAGAARGEAHHWARRYPDAAAVTAADLTALCRTCHWTATLIRLLDRTSVARVWLILTAVRSRLPIARASRGGRSAVAARPMGRRPRCRRGGSGLELRLLAERCRLRLVVAACGAGGSSGSTASSTSSVTGGRR